MFKINEISWVIQFVSPSYYIL